MQLLRKETVLFVTAGIIAPAVLVTGLFMRNVSPIRTVSANQKNLRMFTKAELSTFNGVKPGVPIYLALDGYVYDVSNGAQFYTTGGPYHYLAGRDSSFELHIAGGGIIKRKYPVIGILR